MFLLLLVGGLLTAQPVWQATDAAGWFRISGDVYAPDAVVLNQALARYHLSPDSEWELLETRWDELGYRHQFYRLRHAGVPVDWSRLVIHRRAGALRSVSAFLPAVTGRAQPGLTASQAVQAALQDIAAQRYYWQEAALEESRQEITGDPAASYAPQPELVWANPDFDWDNPAYRLAWKMEVFAMEPLDSWLIYIDASTGTVLKKLSQTQHEDVDGSAMTMYRGQQTITADSVGPGDFRLRAYNRASAGIVTLDLNNSQDVSAAIDFTDDDNVWDNANANWDEAATDVHWGSERAYDYFFNEYGWDSFDGQGGQIRSYVHFGPKNYGNAFWNVDHAGYGDDNGSPHVGLDIVGHEVTHGVIRNTANLIYIDEGGALNEGFADIFGNSIEAYIDSQRADWLVGEDAGASRSMSDPRSIIYPLTSQGNPDTYQGNGWYTGPFDNGGAHGNATVFGYWYYLLSAGGSGTNDQGSAYQVSGIGVEAAGRIAWRMLAYYLTPTAQFVDARAASLLAAEDLFGTCTPQWQAAVNAWHAVGLGEPVRDGDLALARVEVAAPCGPEAQVPVIATLENRGCSTIPVNNLTVIYRIEDPITLIAETVTLPNGLGPGESHQLTFNNLADLSQIRDYELRASLLSNSDPYQANNESELLSVPVRQRHLDGRVTFDTNLGRDSIQFAVQPQAQALLTNGVGVNGSRAIFMEGGEGQKYRLVESFPMWGGPPVDPFDFNPNFGASACFCVEGGEPVLLGFDRRQTYSTHRGGEFGNEFPGLDGDSIMSRQGSILRVTVNGEELARYYAATPDQDPWSYHELDLTPYTAAGPAKVCFEGKMLYSKFLDPTGVGDRILIDNVTTMLSVSSIEDELAAALWLRQGGQAQVAWDLPRAGELALQLLDLQGRSLRQLQQHARSGTWVLPEGLPAGIYFIRAEWQGQQRTLRWLKIH